MSGMRGGLPTTAVLTANVSQCLKAQAMVHYGQATYDAPAGHVPVWKRDALTIEFQPAGGSSAPGAVLWERKDFGLKVDSNLLAGVGLLGGLPDVQWTTTTTLTLIAAIGIVALLGSRH